MVGDSGNGFNARPHHTYHLLPLSAEEYVLVGRGAPEESPKVRRLRNPTARKGEQHTNHGLDLEHEAVHGMRDLELGGVHAHGRAALFNGHGDGVVRSVGYMRGGRGWGGGEAGLGLG